VGESYFYGRFRHSIDEKGRLVIPSRFQGVLKRKGEDIVVITNGDIGLWVYPENEWDKIADEIQNMSIYEEKVKRYVDYFISGGHPCQIKQGRITIPPNLRDVAKLNKDVMVVGSVRFFKIIDTETWEKYFAEIREEFPSIINELFSRKSGP